MRKRFIMAKSKTPAAGHGKIESGSAPARDAASAAARAPERKNAVERPVQALAYGIVHALPGRLRLRPAFVFLDPEAAAGLVLELCPSLTPGEIQVSEKTGSILILYTLPQAHDEIVAAFGKRPEPQAREKTRRGKKIGKKRLLAPQEDLPARNPIPHKIVSTFMPMTYRAAHALWSSLGYLWRGVKAVFSGKLNLDALDGAAMAVCILTRDFRSLSAITFFFALGEFLADWTRKRSRASLADSLALKIDRVWVRTKTADGDLDRQIPFRDVKKGDLVVVHAGAVIPVDGTVAEGEGMVNQAAMTGEPLPVHRAAGASLYAGTVLAEGSLVVKASKVGDDTRISAILHTIEESESVKASIQSRYEHIADAIVPYNFMLCGLVYALTRNAARAGSVLLVDYSCAIRLSTPLSIYTGMRQAAEQGVLIKGGKFMEAVAEADVVVFDKTGTLTQAKPSVVEVLPFDGRTEDEVLRLAACLEEHFVHPVGQAVVRAADERNLKHREEHTRVDYVVAHGIASYWREQRVLVGSAHFIMEDEGFSLSKARQAEVRKRTERGLSALYLAVDKKVAGVLFIEDSIRKDAKTVVEALRRDGIKRVIMLTGDGEETASGIAERSGITEYRSRMLPESKAKYIAGLKRQGHKIIMIGDGINDSPALSEADVGVAMAEGADMAREVADIVLTNGELGGILLARSISREALKRVQRNFVVSVLWNSVFLAGGLFGLFTAGVSALLHNATTAAISVHSLTPFPASMPALAAAEEAAPAPVKSPKPKKAAAAKKIPAAKKTPAKEVKQ